MPASDFGEFVGSCFVFAVAERGFSGVWAGDFSDRLVGKLGGVKTILLDLRISERIQYWAIRLYRSLWVSNRTTTFLAFPVTGSKTPTAQLRPRQSAGRNVGRHPG